MSLFYGREIENPQDAIIDYIKKSNRVGSDELDKIDDNEYLEETFKTAVAIALGLQITPVQLKELPIKLLTLKSVSCKDFLGFINPSKYYVVCNIKGSNSDEMLVDECDNNDDSKKKNFDEFDPGNLIKKLPLSSPFMNIMPLSVVLYEIFKNICNELKLIFSIAPNDKSPHLVSCNIE